MQVVELRLGRSIEDVIREMHYEQGLTQEQVAEKIGVHGATLSRWMEKLGLPVRARTAA